MRKVGFMALFCDQKFARHGAGALVDQLIESVLAVGAGFPPDHGAGMAEQIRAIAGDALAVTLHLQLLQICRQTRQALVVGQHRAGGVAADLVMPKPDKGQQDRHVLRQWGGLEMAVHRAGTGQKVIEGIGADRDHQGQTDGSPKRIAPADPILKAENARGINAIGGSLVTCGRDGGKLRRRGRDRARHPPLGGVGVGHGFNRGEGFGGHDDKRGLRVQSRKRVVDMRTIDVRDEMHLWSIVERGQRQRRHGGTKVRAADADIDHIGDAPALPREATFPHVAGEGFGPGKALTDTGHHVFAVNLDYGIATCPQGNMQDRAAFGVVDLLPREHCGAVCHDVGGFGQIQQKRAGARVDSGL